MNIPTNRLGELRERAASCARLAATSISPETREMMHYLASRWDKLAGEEEARLSRQTAGSHAEPLSVQRRP
jgi:hypothetical protein